MKIFNLVKNQQSLTALCLLLFCSAVNATTIYFKNNSFQNPHVYYWNEDPANSVNDINWPGSEMYNEGNGYYSFTFDSNINAINIIFNDNGNNQTTDLRYTNAPCFSNNQWQSAESCGFSNEPVTALYFKNTGYVQPHLYMFNTSPTNYVSTNWPGDALESIGDGFYKYELSSVINSSGVIFSDNGNPQTQDLFFSGQRNCFINNNWVTQEACGIVDTPPTPTEPTEIWYQNKNYQTPSIYYFNVNPSNAAPAINWPGTALTDQGNNIYKITLTNEVNSMGIVFSDNGQNQSSDLNFNGDNNCYANSQWQPQSVCEALAEGPTEEPNTVIYFNNAPNYSAPHVHLWNASPPNLSTTQWPGIPMKEISNNWYQLDLGTAINSAGVIFNDSGAPQSTDLQFNSNRPCYQSNQWVSLANCNLPSDEPLPPIANAGMDVTIRAGQTVTLSGSASSAENGAITSYQWQSSVFGTLSGEVINTSAFNFEGTYQVTLTVTNSANLSDSDLVTITVIPRQAINERIVLDPPVNLPLSGNVGGGDYKADNAFPALANTFSPLTYITNDGFSDRLYVVEKRGVIKRFNNNTNATADNVSIFLDISDKVDDFHERGLLGLAFDPNYASNGEFYVIYSSKRTSPGYPYGDTVLERYTANLQSDGQVDSSTAFEILSEPQQGPDHKGGMIKFDNAGYLYISLGDGQWSCGFSQERVDECVTWNDPTIRGNNHGQDLTTLKGSILRIRPDSSLPNGYEIPSNNPYSGNSLGYKEEIFANGLRNPWRFDIDGSGNIFVGDVGHETSENTFEEVNRITNGGNYGWPICEGKNNRGAAGSDNYQTANCAIDFEPPITSYQHNGSAASIIGGVFVSAANLPALNGQFLYGDYNLGTVYAVDTSGNNTQVLSNFPENIAAFGTDIQGNVYIVSYNFEFNPTNPSKIWKLVDDDTQQAVIPNNLSNVGLFESLNPLTPRPGVIEYELNVDGWFDGLEATHYIALPGTSAINYDNSADWDFPDGTALVKHLSAPQSDGQTESFTTSILFKQTSGWVSLNYLWNEAGTEATLVSESETVTRLIHTNGSTQNRQFTSLSSSQCSSCHTNSSPLSLSTLQLNRNHNYDGLIQNQIVAMNQVGMFNQDTGTPSRNNKFQAIDNSNASLTDRAKAYLDVNCAHCHSSDRADFRYETPLLEMNLINAETNIGQYKLAPFDPNASGIYLRQIENNGRMPNGSSYTNTDAEILLHEWITASSAQLERVSISSTKSVYDVNEPLYVTAINHYDNDFWTPANSVTWSSSNTAVISVANATNGVLDVKPSATGTTTVTAVSLGNQSNSIELQVIDNSNPTTIEIVPSTINLDDTYTAIALSVFPDGSRQNISGNQNTSWQIISGSEFVSVNNDGTLTKLADGVATLQVSYGTATTTAEINATTQGIWLRYSNPDNWQQVCVYTWNDTTTIISSWPGETLDNINGWYNYLVPNENLGNNDHVNAIFNNCGNGNQTDDFVNITENRSYSGNAQNNWSPWSGNGSIGTGEEYLLVSLNATQNGDGTYIEGEIVTLTADVPSGQAFDRWQGDVAYILQGSVNTPQIDVVMPNRGLSLSAISKQVGVDPEAQQLYDNMCASCHGASGQGGVGPALNVATPSNDSYDELYGRILSNMPPSAPWQCGEDCSDKLTNFIQVTLRNQSAECSSGPSVSPRMLRLLTRTEYVKTINDLLGVAPNSVAAIPAEASVNGFINNADNGQVTTAHYQAYIDLAEEIAASSSFITNSAQISTMGKRIFRRPLTLDEQNAYAAILNEHGSDAAERALLSSANFLYRSEIGSQNAAGFRLTDYEVASFLSYLFWGTTPDDALLAAADNGELSTSAGIQNHAQRLLNDDRAKETIGEFAIQWLRVTDLAGVSRDDPAFANVANDMLDETKNFFAHVIFDSTSTYEELITANYSIVSSELADFYGYQQEPDGRIIYNRGQRAGLLSHGSHLARNATFDEMHPVKRGLMIRETMLCQHLPQPDGIVVSFPQPDPNQTLRERFAVHTSDSTCNECHQYIDGVGFGFSHFDKVGRWMTTDNGNPIDSSGNMNDVETLGSGIDNPYNTIPQLAEIVANSRSAKECFVQSYYQYSHGYEPGGGDECTISTLSNQLSSRELTIKQMMLALTQANNFINRQ